METITEPVKKTLTPEQREKQRIYNLKRRQKILIIVKLIIKKIKNT